MKIRGYGAFAQALPYPPGLERREYPLNEHSSIIELNDMIWNPPYEQDTLHYHNCMEIGVCLEGSGTLIIGSGNEPLSFSAGTVVILPSGLPHCQQNRGNPITRWRYIALDEKRLLSEMPSGCRAAVTLLLEKAQRYGLYAENSDMASETARLINTMFEVKCRFAEDANGELEALLVLLLVRAARQPVFSTMKIAAHPLEIKMIEPALLYVSDHYRQEIRMQQLAGACAMSESYFRKVFRELIAMSPLEYVNRYRIHRAMNLLHVTHSSIQSIAADCGFPSMATFVRNFIRYTGKNPSAWRDACRSWKEFG